MCHQEGLTPKFLNFKLANSNLKHSRTYRQYQATSLKEKIKMKSSIILKQKKESGTIRNGIKKNSYHCLNLRIYPVCFLLVITVN